MNNYDRNYSDLVRKVLSEGHRKNDRTGTGTYSVFGTMLRHRMSEGFPLLTTKKIFTKAVVHELLWFLKGSRNIQYLCENGVSIWDEWPHKKYMNSKAPGDPEISLQEFAQRVATDPDFAEEWGDLGRVYGFQWRKWETRDGRAIDQVHDAIETLKKDPDSRRIIVTAWNPEDVPGAALPPCHYMWTLNTRTLTASERIAHADGDYSWHGFSTEVQDAIECAQVNSKLHDRLDKDGVPSRELSIKFEMRSVDVGLGLPFDVASYALLLAMIAQVVNMVPGDVVCAFSDTHVYLNHVDPLMQQIVREPYALPRLWLNPEVKSIDDFTYDDIKFIDYTSHPAVKMQVAV